MNKLIDALLHPLAEHNPSIITLDGILHGLVEKLSESMRKFLRYNLPKPLAQPVRAQETSR